MMVSVSEVRWFLLIACILIFAVVFALMLISAWRLHQGGAREDLNFHGSVTIEIVWTLAPVFIVVLLVWPTVKSILNP
jgi:cytochrome c oxidase subunit 2